MNNRKFMLICKIAYKDIDRGGGAEYIVIKLVDQP